MELVEFTCVRGHAWLSTADNDDRRCPNLIAGGVRCPEEAQRVGPRVDALARWIVENAREACGVC